MPVCRVPDRAVPIFDVPTPAYVLGEEAENIICVRTRNRAHLPMSEFAVEVIEEDFTLDEIRKMVFNDLIVPIQERLAAVRKMYREQEGKEPGTVLVAVRTPPMALGTGRGWTIFTLLGMCVSGGAEGVVAPLLEIEKATELKAPIGTPEGDIRAWLILALSETCKLDFDQD